MWVPSLAAVVLILLTVFVLFLLQQHLLAVADVRKQQDSNEMLEFASKIVMRHPGTATDLQVQSAQKQCYSTVVAVKQVPGAQALSGHTLTAHDSIAGFQGMVLQLTFLGCSQQAVKLHTPQHCYVMLT
jgi:hypothetical protein